ncbi:hypothetical protein M406DRAFT_34308 [Cryphonectria parasitica EP155]|uniref:Amino acid permease/ SLC12A domain-containing protein n=1 Tax=Cryphonectria parasitica (strain ATCC 38755 / EP155) TaxID=660469 RepID=A0A9P4YC95_CRYP1|nr:uncharacterized protein M406DRAFT_34308 [Cryphonectria parasitica EP155]KAF3770889.1 hypothetical protein M406DRAFT_34308 [Cryphonectria parasitica EP155]
MDHPNGGKKHNKLGLISGVYIPVCLNILSILLFLRFGLILGQVGLMGMLGLLVASYLIDVITTLSLSAVSSNGEVKSGGTYYLISRSLGPEFGGSIGLLFYLAQALNTAMNIVGLIAVLKSNFEQTLPQGYWWTYLLQTIALVVVTALSLAGSGMFSKASNALLIILGAAILSIPITAIFRKPFEDPSLDVEFTGLSLTTLRSNLWPHTEGKHYDGIKVFRDLFGILFPATSGIFAGASMSGDLKSPSRSIPAGTLWAILTTFTAYLIVILSMAASTSHGSLLRNPHILQDTSLYAPTILAGELAVTFFSALMGILGAAKLMQALARDKLFPGSSLFGKGLKKTDEPFVAVLLTYAIAQLALLAYLDQLASLIAIFYMLTFFTMNVACFLLRIGSAPNFRPGFKFFSWQSAFAGAIMSAAAMFFIDETSAATAVCLLIFLFLLLHYLSPPKHWGDISQSLIYHQVRKYLLRMKPEHIKFWRPQIILLVNDPRHQTRLIQFCNSMKKGALYILGHVIVTSDFTSGVQEAKSQQQAWTKYISDASRIKAFVQLNMSPSITWGVRNLILSAGLGGMRPNIAVIGFYNFRASSIKEGKFPRRRRGDTSARILEGHLPTDIIRTEGLMSASDYLTILEDLALRFRMNVAIGKDFHKLETPRHDGTNRKKYIDLWPVQMSAELQSEGKSVLTTNFDTYTLILQLGCILHSVQAWNKVYQLRVLVFVEYEEEVNSERGRVKALLEKLRIEADVLVFHLASGDLATYETIVSGQTVDPITDAMVNDSLKDEQWWDELQTLRGRRNHMSASQELDSLANIVESTAGRPGVFNPHNDLESYGERRRHSIARMAELPKKPTVSTLARLGVNMGIHTANLQPNVFDSSSESHSGSTSENDTDTSDDEGNVDFNDDASAASEGDLGHIEPVRRPLLSSPKSETPQERPGISRTASQVKFSGQAAPPETRYHDQGEVGPMVSFALEPESKPRTEPPSPGESQKDVAIHIPDLLASYQLNSVEEEADNGPGGHNPSLQLSFNDLPSRAQYLILNELLRQNSSDSAVLYTTLPIPAEGTCRSEEASVQYLSDIEVLCSDLPPVLLVLSNNMTYVFRVCPSITPSKKAWC